MFTKTKSLITPLLVLMMVMTLMVPAYASTFIADAVAPSEEEVLFIVEDTTETGTVESVDGATMSQETTGETTTDNVNTTNSISDDTTMIEVSEDEASNNSSSNGVVIAVSGILAVVIVCIIIVAVKSKKKNVQEE